MGCHKNPNPKRTESLVFKPTEAKGENPNGDNFQQDKPNEKANRNYTLHSVAISEVIKM